MKRILFALLLTASAALACKKDSGTETPAPQPAAQVNCDTVFLTANITGGCLLRSVTPAKCQEVDLRNGATFEFAWTSDGTFCETPWRLSIAGNPVTANNIKQWSLSVNTSTGITSYGGIVNVNAADLEGLTSYNGVYHWLIESFHESHPATIAFKVKK